MVRLSMVCSLTMLTIGTALDPTNEYICNMQGRTLRAITIEEEPFVMYNATCINALPPYSDNPYINVTNCVYGWVVDVFTTMQKECNFVLNVFATKENITFGDVIELDNGTLVTSGLFTEIQKFDIILGASFLTLERTKVIKYLYPMTQTKMALFIKNNIGETNHWFMYAKILSLEVWLVLLVIALFPTLISFLKDLLVYQQREVCSVQVLFKKFAASFAINFGGNFIGAKNRATILICHLSYGIIIWIFFRATLTSNLTQRIYEYPFTNLEGLVGTDYALLTLEKDTKEANHFLHAVPGSVEDQVLKGHMTNDSFIGIEAASKKMLDGSLMAIYMNEMVGSYKLAKNGLFCQTLIPWKSNSVYLYSVAVNQNLEQFKALNMVAKKMKQPGLIQKFIAKHDIVPDFCQKHEEVTIGYEKVAPLFLILLFAMSASLVYMLFFEMLVFSKLSN